jgi:hypothetical protein
MFRSIDIKSVLIGGLLAVIILLLLGAVPSVPPDEFGRFQLKTNENYAFILDTATGEAWASLFINPQFDVTIEPDPNFFVPKTSY